MDNAMSTYPLHLTLLWPWHWSMFGLIKKVWNLSYSKMMQVFCVTSISLYTNSILVWMFLSTLSIDPHHLTSFWPWNHVDYTYSNWSMNQYWKVFHWGHMCLWDKNLPNMDMRPINVVWSCTCMCLASGDILLCSVYAFYATLPHVSSPCFLLALVWAIY